MLKTHNTWDATAQYLNVAIPNYHFIIIPMLFDEIPSIVRDSKVDFVIVNSGIYVDLSVKFGIRRVLTLINQLSSNKQVMRFGSVVFTRIKRTKIDNFSDLKGLNSATVHLRSFGGWIMAL